MCRRWMRWSGVGLAALLAACSSGGSGPVGDGGGQGSGLFGLVVDATGQPVAGATVSAGGGRGTTGADGRYALRTSSGALVVRVDRAGFLPAIKQVTVGEEPAALGVTLLPEASPQPLDAVIGGEIQGDRGARAVVPGGALVDASGSPITGMVQVFLTPIDPSQEVELAAAPGDLTAVGASGGAAKLESFGMLDVTIRQGGEKVQLAPNQLMEIAIPAPSSPSGELPAEVPLWSFDEGAGVWRQEGTLTLDAASGSYVGEIAHMSFWNADQEMETACVTGQVLDADTGEPVAGARVMMSGVGYAGSDAATANGEGRFVIFARRSSTARITAYHAETGADQRNVEVGDVQVSPPVEVGDARCTDGGSWRVRRGEVRLPDGQTRSCEVSGLEEFASCLPTLVDVTRCFNPQGGCTSTGLLSYRYENGAAIDISIDSTTGRFTQTFYGAGGVLCGAQIIETSGDSSGGGAGTIRLVPSSGAESSYSFTRSASGDITYQCEDGTSRVFTQAEQDLLQACSGGDGGESCEVDPTQGQACADDGECGQGLACCFGVCTQESICNLGTCGDDAECEGEGMVCCRLDGAERGYCSTELSCTGTCSADAQCGEDALCCDGECVYGQPSCAGFCETSAECEDNGFCCATSELTYCASSEQACYQGIACGADAECGAESGLVCCDRDGAATCDTVEACYGNVPCADTSECYEGLVCCDRFGPGYCVSAASCSLGVACGGDAECGGGLVCCDRPDLGTEGPICYEQAACDSNPPCSSDAECGGGTICCDREDAAFDYCLTPEECTLYLPCTSASECMGESACCDLGGETRVCLPSEACSG